MDRLSILPIVITLVLTLTTACHRGVSGGYMAKFANGVDWLQLVKTPDNHLTGQFVELTVDANGKVDQKNGTFTGAIDGETIILSITGIFGMQSGTLSGNLSGNKLTLTGPQSSLAVLNRVDFDEYQDEVKALNAKAKRLFAIKANVELLNKIDSTIFQMQDFDTSAAARLSRIAEAEERLHAITTGITEYVARERQLTGTPNSAVARGQLNVAAYQASIATTQLHNSAQSLASALETGFRSMSAEVNGLGRWCGGAGLTDLTPEAINARSAACNRLSHAFDLYKQKTEALTRGLSHFEQIYGEESRKQQELLQTAEHLK